MSREVVEEIVTQRVKDKEAKRENMAKAVVEEMKELMNIDDEMENKIADLFLRNQKVIKFI